MSQITFGSVVILVILFIFSSCTTVTTKTDLLSERKIKDESIFMDDVRKLLAKTDGLADKVDVKPVEI